MFESETSFENIFGQLLISQITELVNVPNVYLGEIENSSEGKRTSSKQHSFMSWFKIFKFFCFISY